MREREIIETYAGKILNTYTRQPLIFVKGKGMVLTDIHGRKYLDFFPGWGVSNLGHCHVKVTAAVRDQIGRLIHIPNNFLHPAQARLASEIVRAAFPGKVFFCNSGAEACEAAIKIARAFGRPRRHEIVTMEGSFHGRTLGALSATGQTKYQEGFGPLVPGFHTVPFNDLDAVRSAVGPQTAAVMIEPVQGEGGVRVADPEYVKGLRRLCDDEGLLLIFDEVQTGMGRTGTLFAFRQYNVEPDILVLAKALGGGLPIGAVLAGASCAEALKPGMHGSTFGGGPLVCKAALGVFKALANGRILANARRMSRYALDRMGEWPGRFPCVEEVRGLGLMIGVVLNIEAAGVVAACLERGLIINGTQGSVLRLMPALNVTRKQMDQALGIIEDVLADRGKEDA